MGNADEKVTMIFEGKDELSPVAKGVEKSMKEVGKTAEDTNKNVKQSSSGITKSFGGIFQSLSIGLLAKGLQVAGKKIVELSKKQADYIESLNLLDVAFDGNTKSVREFTSAYSEILNLDEATLINSASHFKMLGQSMGLAADEGERFSKVLTQMNLDVSSLYNLSFKDAQNALQNATMGRGTALKQKTGVSVLESTVQTTLTTLGVDAYIKDMNDTEKAIARVISMIYQLRTSQGDLARTIEAPANQFRVMGEQLSQLARNIGSVFLPAVAAILPYLNAILIVLNKIISALAAFVGFKENMWDFFGESDSLVDAFDDIGDSIGGVGNAASSAAKKLQGLRAFDKLNNLTTPTSSGGGGGGGAGTGINKDLLDLFKRMTGDYNSLLDGLETKATKIAKAIMKELNSFDTSNAVAAFHNLEKAMKPVKEFVFDNLVNFYTEFLKPIAKWTISKAIPTFLDGLAYVTKNVNWGKLTTSLKDLYGALSDFTTTLAEPFMIIWREVLLPIGSYIFNSSVYGIIDFLTGLAKILSVLVKIDIERLKALVDILDKLTGAGSGFLKGGFNLNDVGAAFKDLGDKITEMYENAQLKAKGYSKETKDSFDEISLVMQNFEKSIDTMQLFPYDSVKNKENKKQILTSIDDLTSSIQKRLKLQREESIKGIDELVKNGSITPERKQELIDKVNNYYDELDKTTSNGEERIKQIIEKASKSKVGLTKEDLQEIENIRAGMEKNAVATVSKSAVEQEAILRDFNNSKKELTVQAASEMIQSAIKTRDEEIQAAKDKYIGTLTEAKRLKEIGAITEEEYQKMIDKAYADKELEVRQAQGKYDEIYRALEENHEDIANYIDKDSGGVRSSWDAFWNKIGKKVDNIWDNHISKYFTKEFWQDEWEKLKKGFEVGLGIVKETLNKKWEEIKTWFRNNVGKYFTREYWQGLFTGAFSNIHIKTPHISWTTGGSATGVVKKILETLNLPTSIPKLSVQWYAQGGLPDVGQLFVANEKGPELVGQIGGKSFVANQNQMMSLLDKKLSGSNGMQNATFIIQVGNKEIAKETLTELQSMAKSNGKPIVINAG